MRNLTPVVWNEGLFLRPHHFQQQDRYHVDALGAQLELVNRFHWGVGALEIERSALRNRVVEVSRCALVFPSGEIALAPENAQVDPRSFADHMPPQGRPLEVFIGLPRINATAPNFHDPERALGAEALRYRVRPRSIHDLVSGERPVDLQFAVASLRLLFGDEDRGAFECLKVAEVVQKGPDHFDLSDTYIPACLRIDAVTEMQRLANRVRDGLVATSRTGHGLKRERSDSDASFLVRLSTINAYVGWIAHLAGTGNVHPFHFYATLASAAGAVSAFASEIEATDLPPYLHDDPGPAFRELVRRIEKCLEQAFPTRFVEIRLPWVAGTGSYEAALSDEHLGEAQRYCLAFGGEQPADALRRQVEGTAKIGTPERIPTLRNLALRGIAIRALDSPPAEIPRRPAAFFHLEPAGPEWEKVREVRRLAVYLPGLSDLTVSLFVIRS